jgi:hypothetical protein
MSDTKLERPLTHAERGALGGAPTKYTPAQIEKGLWEMARLGSVRKAAKSLGIPHETLSYWRRGPHHERYLQIRDEHMDVIHRGLASDYEDLARDALETQHSLVERIQSQMDQLAPRETTQALGTMATVGGIATDKTQLLRDKPTSIVKHDVQADIQALARTGVIDVIDGTAEEDSAEQAALSA